MIASLKLLQRSSLRKSQKLLAPAVARFDPVERFSSSSSSPPPRRLNIAKALVKSEERSAFGDILDKPVTVLEGIGPERSKELVALGLTTVRKLANYEHFRLARSLVVLSETEEPDGRLEGAVSNVDDGLDKAFEHRALRDVVEDPVHALQGLSASAAERWGALGVKTIADLSAYKYCAVAEAIAVASEYEHR